MSDKRPLCVIQTAILDNLLKQAKQKMIDADYNFAAEIVLAEQQQRDPSLVARRALRDFTHEMKLVSYDTWQRYRDIYMKHRDASNQTQLHLRIGDQGRQQVEQVRAYLLSQINVSRIMSNPNRGQKMPNVMILICALQWEIDHLQVQAKEII